MAKHRTYSIEFKRQVAQEFLAGESLHGLSRRHDVSRIWRWAGRSSMRRWYRRATAMTRSGRSRRARARPRSGPISRPRRRKNSAGAQRRMPDIAIPVFGYKNHIVIDRAYGFIRGAAVTDAARHDGKMLASFPHQRQSGRRRVGGQRLSLEGERGVAGGQGSGLPHPPQEAAGSKPRPLLLARLKFWPSATKHRMRPAPSAMAASSMAVSVPPKPLWTSSFRTLYGPFDIELTLHVISHMLHAWLRDRQADS